MSHDFGIAIASRPAYVRCGRAIAMAKFQKRGDPMIIDFHVHTAYYRTRTKAYMALLRRGWGDRMDWMIQPLKT